MTINASLLTQIQAALGGSLIPSLTQADDSSDIFEAYIFSLIIKAAIAEGASITFKDVFGNKPTTFVFRTSPGFLSSKKRAYTHAIINFPEKRTLEAHVGIRVSGKSEVLHECDVAVLYQTEAEVCRQNPKTLPRSSRAIIAVECKFYTSNLDLHLARSFLGLVSDLASLKTYFVSNISSPSIDRIFAYHDKNWDYNVVPSSTIDVYRLTNSFQTTFKRFKAMKKNAL